MVIMFPSPCGVFGVKEDSLLKKEDGTRYQFPSPCGVFGVKEVDNDDYDEHIKVLVSVPLRGGWGEREEGSSWFLKGVRANT